MVPNTSDDIPVRNDGEVREDETAEIPLLGSPDKDQMEQVTGTLKRLVEDVLFIQHSSLEAGYRRDSEGARPGSSLALSISSFESSRFLSRTIVDWDAFLRIFEALERDQRQTAANYRFHGQAYLLHYVCACGAPEDVVNEVVAASALPVSLSWSDLGATPLHLACCFGCSTSVIQDLIHADVDGVTLLARDAKGRLPIHIACQHATTESRLIVQALINADSTRLSLTMKDNQGATPLQIASQYSSEAVIQLLLSAALDADRTESSTLAQEWPRQLPLHRAVRTRCQTVATRGGGEGDVVKALATGSPSLMTMRDRRGQLPLHVACSVGNGHFETFRALIGEDKKGETFRAKDINGRTPSDLLLARIQVGDRSVLETLQLLADADPKRKFFGTVDEDGETLLDSLLRCSKGFCPSDLSKVCLYLLLQVTPPGAGSYAISVAQAQELMGRTTYEKLLGEKRMHHTMNGLMSKRSFTVMFMMDLYARFLLVSMFSISFNRAIDRSDNMGEWPFVLTYVSAMYLLLWQVKLLWNHQLYYLREAWNMLDICTQILIVVTTGLLESGKEVEGAFRTLNVLAGGLAWFVIITVALRSTFLPFAVFVNGLMTILLYMIPFGTTTFLMLGSFAEMYFRSTSGREVCADDIADDFCSYGPAFLKVYAMFVSGVDPTLLSTEIDRNLLWLTIFYTWLFAIVMLNVLVAVIFDAWGRVSPYGHTVFWWHRHRFLIETSEQTHAMGNTLRYFGARLNYIDRHICGVISNFQERPRTVTQSNRFGIILRETVLYVLEAIYLLLWFIMGLLTVGVLWPLPFRCAVLILHVEEDKDDRRQGAPGVVEAAVAVAHDASIHKTRPTQGPVVSSDVPLTRAEFEGLREELAASRRELQRMSEALQEVAHKLRESSTPSG